MAVGRFAPSPSGPLHIGSLLAAVASYLDVRAAGGRWLVRMDDLDTPRNIPGADALILDTLRWHGLQWDAVVRQSERLDLYAAAVADLDRAGLTYHCRCSRKSLRGVPVYPGTCSRLALPESDTATRLRVTDAPIGFHDLVQGSVRERLTDTVGDFIVVRRDGQFGYQLVCAVDEAGLGITRVVRGADLLASTPRQIYVARCLGLATPEYAHIPVIVERRGAKISKQTFATEVDRTFARRNLLCVLDVLGLAPDGAERRWQIPDLLAWAAERFDIRGVPGGDTVNGWIST